MRIIIGLQGVQAVRAWERGCFWHSFAVFEINSEQREMSKEIYQGCDLLAQKQNPGEGRGSVYSLGRP